MPSSVNRDLFMRFSSSFAGASAATLLYFSTVANLREDVKQMQADFVVFRRSGRLSAFVATLGFSRMTFVRCVSDGTWPTVKACLQAAFGTSAARRARCSWTR